MSHRIWCKLVILSLMVAAQMLRLTTPANSSASAADSERGRIAVPDIRDRLLASAAAAQKDFAKGKWLRYKQLTDFAYIGKVDSCKGPLYVCSQSEVLTNMSAPRGIQHLVLFDAHERYLGRMRYLEPLWCEGSTVYCKDSENYYNSSGNAVDLSDGFQKAWLQSEYVCGSPLLMDGATPEQRQELIEEVGKSEIKSIGVSIPNTKKLARLDARERMLLEASKHEPGFPLSESGSSARARKLIMFAYLAKLSTKDGVIHVCDQSVIDVAAPEGPTTNAMVFFDKAFRYLGRIEYTRSHPLWVIGGKLFLWGDDGAGNVIDMTNGFAQRRQYHKEVYGSSGGTPAPQAH